MVVITTVVLTTLFYQATQTIWNKALENATDAAQGNAMNNVTTLTRQRTEGERRAGFARDLLAAAQTGCRDPVREADGCSLARAKLDSAAGSGWPSNPARIGSSPTPPTSNA